MADCPAEITRLSGATHRTVWCILGNSSPTTSSRWHWWREATELSGMTSGLSSVKAYNANGHLWCQIQRLGAPDRGNEMSGAPPDCLVCHIEHRLFSNG
jgi:hypothetical protein